MPIACYHDVAKPWHRLVFAFVHLAIGVRLLWVLTTSARVSGWERESVAALGALPCAVVWAAVAFVLARGFLAQQADPWRETGVALRPRFPTAPRAYKSRRRR